MRESDFQKKLILKLKDLLPGCSVLKNNANYRQGFPDLTIFYKNHYFVLECKRSIKAHREYNQTYFVDQINSMGGYARFIYPENEKEILDEIVCISRAS